MDGAGAATGSDGVEVEAGDEGWVDGDAAGVLGDIIERVAIITRVDDCRIALGWRE